MKDIKELSERMDSNDEIVDNLIKKSTELEKRISKTEEINIRDYTAALETIIAELERIKPDNQQELQHNLLKAISGKLDSLPKSATRQCRFLLFPETNQGQYYKIVFGRLIPWGLCFVLATYIFITGYKAIEVYRYNQTTEQSAHYERAWLYLQRTAKKKMLCAMDEAYDKTTDK